MTAPTAPTAPLEAWAAWHPKHGFEEPFGFEGPVAFADLDSAVRRVRELNREDRTTNRNGWRATKVLISRAVG